MSRRNVAASWGVLCTYALAHAAVDACCAVMLWSAYQDGRLTAGAAWSAFLFYNLLAFAMQPLVGLAADRLLIGRGAAVTGALLTAAALPLALVPGVIAAAAERVRRRAPERRPRPALRRQAARRVLRAPPAPPAAPPPAAESRPPG
jgi:hypothetical protein